MERAFRRKCAQSTVLIVSSKTPHFTRFPSDPDMTGRKRAANFHVDAYDVNALGVEVGCKPRSVTSEVAPVREIAPAYRDALSDADTFPYLLACVQKQMPSALADDVDFIGDHKMMNQVYRSLGGQSVPDDEVRYFHDKVDQRLRQCTYSHAYDAPENVDSILLVAGRCLGEFVQGKFAHRQGRVPERVSVEELGDKLLFGEFNLQRGDLAEL
jgi:hypothetical protein